MSTPLSLAFLVFDHMELLDFAGPFDVMTNSAMFAREQTEVRFTVVSPRPGIVHARGVRIEPDISVTEWDGRPVDILFIPGGNPPGGFDAQRPILGDDFEVVHAWIDALRSDARIIATICVGALIGARAGLFEGKEVTTHQGMLDFLRRMLPDPDRVVSGVRFTENPGQPAIVTSAGVSAGIDLAFHLVESLFGPQVKQRTLTFMEYPPPG
jgi:transcriptional regulator GlxA family with amidase domain